MYLFELWFSLSICPAVGLLGHKVVLFLELPCCFKEPPYCSLPAMQDAIQRIHLQCRRPQFDSWVGKIHWRRDRLPTPVFLGFPCGSVGKESTCNAGDLGLIPGLGRSPREGKGYPLQYSGLENSMDTDLELICMQ